MRARDALGRRVPADSPAAVEPVSEEALPPLAAVACARELLRRGRAFSAHEIFEAIWKAGPAAERDLWQGLAQLCVGLTHVQRGNRVGAVTLLRRGAGHLHAQVPRYGLEPPRLICEALALADAIEAGAPAPELRI